MRIARIPPRMFKIIERYASLSSVDIIVEKDHKLLLTKRAIAPYRGYWHLPGSIILKNEPVLHAVRRSVGEELGIRVSTPIFLGIYELFTRKRHYITQTFVAHYRAGQIRNDWQSTKVEAFLLNQVPDRTVPIHKKMIRDALKARLLR